MRIAIAGTSGHIHYVLDALTADPTLSVAAVSPGAPGESIAQLLAKLDRMGHWPQVFESAEDMVKVTGIDIVVAAAPFYRNAPITIAALRRSLAVFCDKPLALSLEALQEVMREQRASGRPVCAMMGLRAEPHFAAAKRVIDSGALGAPLLITAQKSYKLGQRPEFYTRRETYGGTIPWIGIHAIDWCAWLGGRRFVDVTARHTTQGNGGFGTMESAAAMLFSLEGGGVAMVNADFLRPAGAYTHGDDRVRVVGEGGVLETRAGHAYFLPEKGFQNELELIPGPGVFEAFAASLRGECENPVPTEEGFYCTAAALIAREAADTGKMLKFADYGW